MMLAAWSREVGRRSGSSSSLLISSSLGSDRGDRVVEILHNQLCVSVGKHPRSFSGSIQFCLLLIDSVIESFLLMMCLVFFGWCSALS